VFICIVNIIVQADLKFPTELVHPSYKKYL